MRASSWSESCTARSLWNYYGKRAWRRCRSRHPSLALHRLAAACSTPKIGHAEHVRAPPHEGGSVQKIEAILREERLPLVLAALGELGYGGITMTQVRGHGRQRGVVQQWRS